MSTADNDPSMDDILASIRKIISDDEARAQVGGNAMPPLQAANTGDRPATNARAGMTGNRDDVLLLTDLIEEPKAADVPPPQRIDPVRAGEMPQPAFETMPSPPPASMPSAFEPSIVASSAAGAASSAFDRLNQVVEERRTAPAPAPAPLAMPSPAMGAGGKTIEDLVKEMLRPMLKDWIDRSLPPMVERLVEREIARLTRR
jgi:cell pole-organizing protein PopZ